MIKIYPDSITYIACPANAATGGPESLHQLGYHLRNDLNIEAFMYYFDFDSRNFKNPIHPEFEFYNLPYELKIPEEKDNPKNVLIVPEVQKSLFLLHKYKHIRKAVWFLSVDNYYLSKVTRKDHLAFIIKNPRVNLDILDITSQEMIKQTMLKYGYKKDPLLNSVEFFLFQSNYALHHFKDLRPNYYLSSYLNKSFFEERTDLSRKENIVAYNPKKGFRFTRKIISSAKDIKFVPLINMSRKEIIQTLQRTKVYIDFGNHPGKDRLPREAAILGCCIITGTRGSSGFFEDVPIPEQYKFEDKKESIPKIVKKIKDCLENFENRYKDFEYYRQVIINEPQKFGEDLKKIFVKVEQ